MVPFQGDSILSYSNRMPHFFCYPFHRLKGFWGKLSNSKLWGLSDKDLALGIYILIPFQTKWGTSISDKWVTLWWGIVLCFFSCLFIAIFLFLTFFSYLKINLSRNLFASFGHAKPRGPAERCCRAACGGAIARPRWYRRGAFALAAPRLVAPIRLAWVSELEITFLRGRGSIPPIFSTPNRPIWGGSVADGDERGGRLGLDGEEEMREEGAGPFIMSGLLRQPAWRDNLLAPHAGARQLLPAATCKLWK
jgi:hypothetical protein